MRNQQNDVGDELKAVAQDMLALGARAMRTGRDWLSDWRNDMSGHHHGPQPPPRGAGQHGYQAGRGQQWQDQGQEHRDRSHGHSPDYYASRDYGRGQAYGREGLHAEYGSHGGSYQEYGQAEDNRFGERGQSGRGRQARSRGQAQWSRGGRGYDEGHPQGYADRDPGRRAGTGYGSSSSYGDPDEYNYAGDYGRPSFVNPADTQFRGGGYGSGRYGGMGPRNYTRPDSRINEDLCERLTHDPDIDASDIEVNVSEGTVRLEGSVGHRWMKHRAEDLADGCGGVRNVENNIRVQSRQGEGTGQSGASRSHASGGSETGSPSTPTSRSAGSGGSQGQSGGTAGSTG